MKPEIKTEFNRDHYYYHRYDPAPWIPFDEEDKYDYRTDVIVGVASIISLLVLWWLL